MMQLFNQIYQLVCYKYCSEPSNFSIISPFNESNKPVWGTCPNTLTPITDANFQTAINTCLATNPVDGYVQIVEYGAMPDWDVSQCN